MGFFIPKNLSVLLAIFGGLRWTLSTRTHTETSSMHYVYLLRCSDGTIYTGCTSNLESRLKRHNKGYVSYTSSQLPIKLETYVVFPDKYKAYNFEKYLKSGSGKAFANKRLL